MEFYPSDHEPSTIMLFLKTFIKVFGTLLAVSLITYVLALLAMTLTGSVGAAMVVGLLALCACIFSLAHVLVEEGII